MSVHDTYGYNTENFRLQGGDTTAFEGTVTFLGNVIFQDADIDGLPKAEFQSDSTATTVAALKDDFNLLLGKLKDAGLMNK